jgi:hypothetical protein
MLPGTTEWTCPDCGHEHGAVTMGQLEPDDPPTAATDQAAEPAARSSATSRSATAQPRGGPPTRGRLAGFAIAGIAVVLAVAFALSAFGDSGGTAAAASLSPSVDPVAALCLHLRDLQTPREDSLTRLGDTLQADASAIQAQGDAVLAAKVLDLRTAALAYRDALVSQGDLTEAATQLGKAVNKLPCGT